ncbi:MAG TPA: hypothetical protein VFI67_08240, partial [Sphingomicrobium sp.]|nr:hypothetical protein [Sphingomicrobium sp.]
GIAAIAAGTAVGAATIAVRVVTGETGAAATTVDLAAIADRGAKDAATVNRVKAAMKAPRPSSLRPS